MSARLAGYLLLPAALALAACNEVVDPDLKPLLQLEMRADSLGLGDSMSVRVRMRENGVWGLVPDAHVQTRDPSIVGLFDHDEAGLLLVGNGLGSAWVVGSAGGMVDSVRIEVKLLPITVAGFEFRDTHSGKPPFHDPRYFPVDGMCFTFTNQTFKEQTGEETWFRQMGGFVVNGLREPLWRGTTAWTMSNPGIFEVQLPADSLQDRLVRPIAQGYTRFEMRDGPYTGYIHAWVDLVNGCQGIAPGAGAGDTGFVPEPFYVW
jgi:hypothetical protein